MVFILGISLGFTALMLRSAIAVAGVGILIVTAFLGAALFSAHGIQFLPLVIAVAGYNAGLAGGFVGMMAMRRLGTA